MEKAELERIAKVLIRGHQLGLISDEKALPALVSVIHLIYKKLKAESENGTTNT